MSLSPNVQPPPWMCRNAPAAPVRCDDAQREGAARPVDLDRASVGQEHRRGKDALDPRGVRGASAPAGRVWTEGMRRQQPLELGVEGARLGEQRFRVGAGGCHERSRPGS